MATAKAEFLYQYNKANGVSFSNKLFAKSSRLNKIGAHFPKLTNAIYNKGFTSKIIKKISGMASERSLPFVSSKSFNKILQINKIKKINI